MLSTVVEELKSDIAMIPSLLYSQILENMPVSSVEAMILMNKSLLFVRRNNSPVKGEWWFVGGRIRKGESLEEALFREVKEETNLDVTAYRLINVYSRAFPERHDITIAYLCNCKGKVILNNEHSEYKFFKNVPIDLHPYLLRVIKDSNWQKQPIL